jgi:MFS family permease
VAGGAWTEERSEPHQRGPLRLLTHNRDFRWLFAAELVIFGADWFVLIPLLGLLGKLTGGGLAGGLALAIDTGVGAFLLPYTGTVADRVDRRKILITANLCAVAGIGLLFAVHSGRTAWLGLAGVGAVAVAKAFASPAVSAAIPNLVEPADLSAAMAITGAAWGTMSVVGASLGGVLASALSPYTCFGIAAVALWLATALCAGVRRPMQVPRDRATPHPPALAAIREALRYLAGQPRVRALVTVKCAVGLGNGVLVVYPVLAALMHAGSAGTGLLFAARGAGALFGPLIVRRLYLRRPDRLLLGLAIAMLVYGGSYLAIAATLWLPAVVGLILLAHGAGASNWAMSSAAMQALIPDELRGRVVSADLMLMTVVMATSQIVIGLLVDHTPPRVLVAACGSVTILYALGWRLVTRRLVRQRIG